MSCELSRKVTREEIERSKGTHEQLVKVGLLAEKDTSVKEVASNNILRFIKESIENTLVKISDNVIKRLEENNYRVESMTSFSSYVTYIGKEAGIYSIVADTVDIPYNVNTDTFEDLENNLYIEITKRVEDKENNIIYMYMPIIYKGFIGFIDISKCLFNEYVSLFTILKEE